MRLDNWRNLSPSFSSTRRRSWNCIFFSLWREGSFSRGCVSFSSFCSPGACEPPFSPQHQHHITFRQTRTPEPWPLGTLLQKHHLVLGECQSEAHSGVPVSSGLRSFNPDLFRVGLYLIVSSWSAHKKCVSVYDSVCAVSQSLSSLCFFE